MKRSGSFNRTIDEILKDDSLDPLTFILALLTMVVYLFLESFKTTIKQL